MLTYGGSPVAYASQPVETLLIYYFATFIGNEHGNKPQVNIKPLTDRFIDFNSRLEFQHRLALISNEIYESTKQTCRGNYVYTDPSNALYLVGPTSFATVIEKARTIVEEGYDNR
ncbi:peptidase S10, serine carboxypeptidase, alpha/beta hydrolase fold protein [Tanacetum coccineum]